MLPILYDGASSTGRFLEPPGLVALLRDPKVAADLYKLCRCADYVLFTKDERTIGIERKTANDFFNSTSRRTRQSPEAEPRPRMSQQISRLIGGVDVPILLLEGPIGRTSDSRVMAGGVRRRWHYNYWLAWQVYLPVKLIWTDSHEGTAWVVNYLSRWASEHSASELVGYPPGLGAYTEELVRFAKEHVSCGVQ